VTRTTSARLAGFAYLFYIAVAFLDMVLMNRATAGEGTAAKLASIAQHATDIRISVVLTLLSGLSALVLAVTLSSPRLSSRWAARPSAGYCCEGG
jgi:hypothetical protein